MANIIGGSIGAGKAILNDYTLGVEDIDGGHRLTITRGSEVQTMDVLDGKNGADGKDGAPGADGRDGIDGKDGAPGAVQTVNGEAPDKNGNVQVSGLPDGASANQQLVTDREGVVKWEEKPFYHFQDTEVITWDGDTTGREEVSLGDLSFYKISDTIYPPDSIIGSTFTIMRNGVPEDIVITDEMFTDMSSNFPGTWSVSFERHPVLGSGPALDFVGSSGGLYYLKTNSYYVSSFSLISTVLKEIDPVYIPAIPAEKLPEIPVEKLPFSIFSEVQKTFEGSFDKVTEGRDTFIFNAYNYYKISEFALKREDVISFSGTRASGVPFSTITEGENCCQYGHFIVVYQAGQCRLAADSTTSYSFNAPSAGLYACYRSDNDSMTAGTYNFTYKFMGNMIQSPTTFKRYYLDVDDSGALIATEVTE